MTFDLIVLSFIAVAVVFLAIFLACGHKNQTIANTWLEEMVDRISELHAVSILNHETAFAQRERIIKAIAAIPVRPPLAMVGHVAPGGTRGNAPITSIPTRTPTPAPPSECPAPGWTPTSAPPQMDQPAFPKPLKKVEDEDWPRAHHSGPPSPMHVPPAFPKPLKKVDEDWPQHD